MRRSSSSMPTWTCIPQISNRRAGLDCILYFAVIAPQVTHSQRGHQLVAPLHLRHCLLRALIGFLQKGRMQFRNAGREALFLLNQEFRFPVWRSLKGVLFYDAGNVYVEVSDFDPTDLRHVLGAGLRLETPIGPVRLESVMQLVCTVCYRQHDHLVPGSPVHAFDSLCVGFLDL